jgi:hypothetical protein
MERFLKRYDDRVIGTIAGLDRILFRGNLSSICYLEGMDVFLSSQHVRYKDFKPFALKISGRIKDHAQEIAQKAGRPFVHLPSAKESKEEIAREIMERDQIKEGLICVLGCVEPCQTFSVRGDRTSKQLRLVIEQRKCSHYYFYYLDREFGFMHVRLQSWLPLQIQVCINGREYLAQQMRRQGISFEQHDNCFTRIDDLARAQKLMDKLNERNWASTLSVFARRVNPWLNQKGDLVFKPYYWTVRQSEYALDVIFRDQKSLAEIYPALLKHAINQFSSRDVLRFLDRHTNARFSGESKSEFAHRVEGLRVKHFVEENSIKMYDKAGSILRIETTINNPKRFRGRREGKRNGKSAKRWLPLRKGIVDLKRRMEISRAANERYLEALSVVGVPTPSHKLLDSVAYRVEDQNHRRYRALRPVSPEESRVFRVVLRGENNVQGVRNEDIRRELYPGAESEPEVRRKAAARVTRQLLLLKAHGLIYKVLHTHYYRTTKKGHEIMNTALKFRDSDLALLAA